MRRAPKEQPTQGLAGWDALAEAVFTGFRAWRVQHPRATFTESEQALDARWARARILTDAALASAARDLGRVPAAARPGCSPSPQRQPGTRRPAPPQRHPHQASPLRPRCHAPPRPGALLPRIPGGGPSPVRAPRRALNRESDGHPVLARGLATATRCGTINLSGYMYSPFEYV